MPRWCGITTTDTISTYREPGWMNYLEDHWVYVGESLEILLGPRHNDQGDLMEIAVFFGAASRFCTYNPLTNSVFVNGDLTTIDDAKNWAITVEVRFADESDLFESDFYRIFTETFNL